MTDLLTPDFAAVREASDAIAGLVHRTPVMTCSSIDRLAGRSVFFKCENFQKTGSFKIRGASNAIRKLPSNIAARGVVTHSSGNHGQAVALAARLRGIPATIVMPQTTASVKKDAVIGYGGTVVECEPNLAERERVSAEVVERTGATLIHPYNHPDIIAGQGTLAMELLDQVSDLDAILSPVGGGGLISGISIGAKGLRPGIRIFGAEPLNANDAANSKRAGMLVNQDPAPTSIADGLLAGLGNLTWPIVRDQVETIFTVTEEQIRTAMKLVWERMKLVIEPSSAVGVAVLLSDEFRAIQGVKRIGVVLCGGNVSFEGRI